MNFIKKFINILIIAFHLFIKDRLQTRANAIAYAILVSIIPLLTILMRVANINQQELIENINRLFSIYGITGIQPIIDIIQDILSRANTISGIGVLFLIYATLNIFLHLEESANQIFKASSRGFLIRTSIYTSWLIFIPLIMIFLFDISNKVYDFLKKSNFIVIKSNQKLFYILDDEYHLFTYDNNLQFQDKIDYIKKTDFLVLDRKIIINNQSFDYDLTGDSLKTFIKQPMGMELEKNLILIYARPSILFFSRDNGFNWDFRYFIYSNKGKSFEFPIIEDLKVLRDEIYILLTISQQSYLIVLDKNYFDVKWNIKFNAFYNKIRFFKDKIFLIGQGNLLFSENKKWNWSQLSIPQLNTTFEEIYFFDNQSIILTATKRLVIYHEGKVYYPLLRINHLNLIYKLIMYPEGEGFIISQKDLRYTLNYGNDWYIARFFDSNNNEVKLFSLQDAWKENKIIYFIGENQSIYKTQIFSISIDPKTDLPLIKLKLLNKQELHPFGLWLPKIIVLFLDYSYIVILFTLFYIILPNKNISLRSAFFGGLIASIGIILFISIFKLILPFFSSSRIVYGIWFSIPIAMLILLSTIEIFLFGLEVTRVHMNPELINENIIKHIKIFNKK